MNPRDYNVERGQMRREKALKSAKKTKGRKTKSFERGSREVFNPRKIQMKDFIESEDEDDIQSVHLNNEMIL